MAEGEEESSEVCLCAFENPSRPPFAFLVSPLPPANDEYLKGIVLQDCTLTQHCSLT